jgi:DNA-binding transcriptional regulator YdaS (Cro superfamily)
MVDIRCPNGLDSSSMTRKKDAALQRAITMAGGPAALARVIGVTAQAVSKWKKCPPRRAVAVEKATGGVVKRERLCPQVFIGQGA